MQSILKNERVTLLRDTQVTLDQQVITTHMVTEQIMD